MHMRKPTIPARRSPESNSPVDIKLPMQSKSSDPNSDVPQDKASRPQCLQTHREALVTGPADGVGR
eukprot:1952054-Amphidinium_carterae.1